jgi:hypothetical protein
MANTPSSSVARPTKSANVPAASFSLVGGRQKATVAFALPFQDATYVVTCQAITGTNKNYLPKPESKTASGFTINLNSASLSGLIEVSWQAESGGE